MNELALFAGAGGGILGSHLIGWKTVCAVEIERSARHILMARQNDGILGPFPIWDDVRTFDGRPWKGIVDVVSGGFPCTDIAACKYNPEGIEGKSSGLWKEMARIIGEVEPSVVLIENSNLLRGRGLPVVISDLCGLGYDARWKTVQAAEVGAPHGRKRIWIVAYSNNRRAALWRNGRDEETTGAQAEWYDHLRGIPEFYGGEWWKEQPRPDGVVDGVANRVDRLKAAGNGQVPAVAALAWETLKP